MESRLIQVYGFHGTNRAAARSILEQGFRLSSTAYDWLGDGIYFWQDAPRRAEAWAAVNKGYGNDAAVVGASIHLRNCMDLLDIGWERPILEAYTAMVRRYQQAGRRLPRQKGGAHRLDREMVNFAVRRSMQRGRNIQAVRAAFQEGEPVFPGSALCDRSHVRIAILDTALIVNQ